MDHGTLCLLPVASHDEPIPADGQMTVRKHIVMVRSASPPGLEWLTMLGMRTFGLPDLEVQRDRIRGRLANHPKDRRDLRAGQFLELREADVFDWVIARSDGSLEGNYTVEVLRRDER